MQVYFIETQPSAGRHFLHRQFCVMTVDEHVSRADDLPVLGQFPDLAAAMRAGKRLFRAFPCPYCCFKGLKKSADDDAVPAAESAPSP